MVIENDWSLTGAPDFMIKELKSLSESPAVLPNYDWLWFKDIKKSFPFGVELIQYIPAPEGNMPGDTIY